ncbi:hypothetical protein EB795_12440 [Pseudomonas mandelii]|nr:hypothetical protein [Pseudomonas mandelii]
MDNQRPEPVQQLQPGAGVVGGAGADRRRRRPPLTFDYTQNNCGSEPARDDVITFNIFVDCQTAIAGKPAPTFFVLRMPFMACPRTWLRFGSWH